MASGVATERDSGVAPRHRRWLHRALALAFAAAVVAYPVRSFLTLDALPLWARLAWCAALVLALRAPRMSLLIFVAAAPALEAVPAMMGWPEVSPGEMWLLALLVAAWLEIAAGKAAFRTGTPPWLALLIALSTASMLTVMYPFYLAAGSVRDLLNEVHRFLLQEYILVRGPGQSYTAIVTWMMVWEGLALLWLALQRGSANPRRFARQLCLASAAGCLVVVGYGLWSASAHTSVPLYQWARLEAMAYRIQSTFHDSVALGSYFSLMVWVLVGLAGLRPSGVWRWGWRVGAAVVALGLFFTASRAAWFATAAAAVLFAMALPRYRLIGQQRWLVRRFRIVAAAVAVALLCTLGALSAYATSRDIRSASDKSAYLERVLGTFNLKAPIDQALLNRRAEYWRAAAQMVKAEPAFGIGIGRYYNDVHRFAPNPEQLIWLRGHAHNYYLQLAGELGLTGLTCFVALLLLPVGAARRVLLSAADVADRHLALGVGVGIGGFALTMVTGHPLLLREAQHAFWPVVAAALLLANGTVAARRTPDEAASRWRRLRPALVPALVLLILVTAAPRARMRAATVDRLKVFVGINEVRREPNGYEWRWLDQRASFFVPGHARLLEIPLRSLAPFTQHVTVEVDGRTIEVVGLADHDWHVVRYQLPAATYSGFRKVALTTDRPWLPPGEPRPRGAMIGETAWRSAARE